MKKRIISLFCIIALFAVMFTGCNNTAEQTGSDAVTSSDVASVDPSTNPGISIVGSEITEYSIVFADEATTDFKMKAAQFRGSVSDALGGKLGTVVDKSEDAANIPATAKEIVIGTTRRPSNRMLANQLRENDYLVACFDGRIYIMGGSESATLEALEYFIGKYVNSTDKKIELAGELCDIVKNTQKEYPINTVQIDGVNIREYNVVIPAEADLSTQAAAEQLSDWFLVNAGYSLNIINDAMPESDYELLIGNTNREASKSTLTTDASKLEYVLYKNGTKIVALGDSFMVGGGVGAIVKKLPLDGKEATVNITDIPAQAEVSTFEFEKAENAILMIGDGMGFNQIEMALPVIDGKFIAADLPNRGESMTDNVYGTTTDSAAGGTALSSGYKTSNGRIGMDKDAVAQENIREGVYGLGGKTAVITNDDIYGATPGSFLAHSTDRGNTDDILSQINKLLEEGKVDIATGKVGDELCLHVTNALKTISDGNGRYFMMVEEARIDKESHNNNGEATMQRVKTFNETIARVIQFVLMHPDTALIVTADHETGGLTKSSSGAFVYTTTNHSSANVPIFAIGDGTEAFNGQAVQNVEIARVMAKVYGGESVGQ